MAKLRGKNKGKSRNLGTEIGKREAKKGLKLSDGRFYGRTFAE
jgi:hypothetical protein